MTPARERPGRRRPGAPDRPRARQAHPDRDIQRRLRQHRITVSADRSRAHHQWLDGPQQPAIPLDDVALRPAAADRYGRAQEPVTTPVLYTAAITCVPDVTAPCADSDGRHRQHTVGSGHIAGSRGPWPMPDKVRAIDFLFSRQRPVGSAPAVRPSGVLRVDIATSTATWQQKSRPAVAAGTGNRRPGSTLMSAPVSAQKLLHPPRKRLHPRAPVVRNRPCRRAGR